VALDATRVITPARPAAQAPRASMKSRSPAECSVCIQNDGVMEYLNYYLEKMNEVSPRVGYIPVTDEVMKQNRETLEASVPKIAAK